MIEDEVIIFVMSILLVMGLLCLLLSHILWRKLNEPSIGFSVKVSQRSRRV